MNRIFVIITAFLYLSTPAWAQNYWTPRPGVFSAHATFLDGVCAKFGTDNDFSICYQTATTPDVARLTVPAASNLLVFSREADLDYDFANVNLSPDAPSLLFTTNAQNRNEWGMVSMDGTGNRSFSVSSSGGDDLDGTANNANGVDIYIKPGDGGTTGGRGGHVQLVPGLANGGNGNAGDILLRFSSGNGTGRSTVITPDQSNQDIRFKNSGTGVLAVIDSGSTAQLNLDHDGTSGLVNSSTGIVRSNAKFYVNGAPSSATIWTQNYVLSSPDPASGGLTSVVSNQITTDVTASGNTATPVTGSFSTTILRGGFDYTSASGNFSSFNSFTHNGTGTITLVESLVGNLAQASTGIITDAASVSARFNQNTAATTTRQYGFWAKSITVGAGTVGTAYGVKIDARTGGTTRWGLAVETDPSYFNAKLRVGANTAPSATLDVTGSIALSGRFLGSKGADIASAALVNLGTDGNYFYITGNATIECIADDGWSAGSIVYLQFDDAATLTHNHACADGEHESHLSGGANFVASAGDTIMLLFDGNGWREVARTII